MPIDHQLFLQGMAAMLKNLIEHQHRLCISGGGEYKLEAGDVKVLLGSWRKTDFATAELPPGVYSVIEPYL